MSKPDDNDNHSIVVPYVGIDPVIELAVTTYKNSIKERKLTELSLIWKGGKSNLKNITPTFSILGLGTVKNGIFSLTPDGLVFADACNSKDMAKAKQVIRKNIQKSKALEFTQSLLEAKSNVSTDDIGRSIAERFKKKWKDIRTAKHFGNCCASILSFAGIGYYYNGALSVIPPTVTQSSSIPAPEATYNEIIEVLNALHGFERATTSDIAKKQKQKQSTIYQRLTICSFLKLVEKQSSNIFQLSDKGQKLIEPIIDEQVKQEIFRQCLLQSPYKEIIKKFSNIENEITNEKVADILVFYLKRNWSEETRKIYIKKFTNWMVKSGIFEKIKPGEYKMRINLTNKEFVEKDTPNNIQKDAQIDVELVYEIGRSIGSLETIMPTSNQESYFNDRVIFLKELLNGYDDLKLTLDMLTTNFEMASKSNNTEIFKSNLDFVRNKIKEKILGEQNA